jgi:hypothetical protein
MKLERIGWWTGVGTEGDPKDGVCEGGSLRSMKLLILSLKIIPIPPALSIIRLGSHRCLICRYNDRAEKSVNYSTNHALLLP